MAQQSAVNRLDIGSSPIGGAFKGKKVMEKEETLTIDKTTEKAMTESEDNIKLNSVLSGSQTVNTEEYGPLIFIYPGVELSLKADKISAQFRAKALRENLYLTDRQYLAIYNQPLMIDIDGKQVKIGNGDWPESQEREYRDELPKKLKVLNENFSITRQLFQEQEEKILQFPKDSENYDATLIEMQKERDSLESRAKEIYSQLMATKAKQLELASLRARLFSDSLEEQLITERIKILAPGCIKKYNDKHSLVPLWNSEKELLEDGFAATKVLALFNLFLRGFDVSFFGELPVDQISS